MYEKMLDTIGFSASDTLYFIGDAADRGPSGVAIWLDTMKRDNVVFIRGNHEQLCLDAIGSGEIDESALKLWFMNAGRATYEAMQSLSKSEYEQVLSFLMQTPLSLRVSVGKEKYYLVHGFPAWNDFEKLWKRPTARSKYISLGSTAVIGHTPTCFLSGSNEPMRIWHGHNFIDIDCGCGQNEQNSCLACLRLEDMQEWYI